MAHQDVDELFEIKNFFYVGNYQHTITIAQKLKPTSPEVTLERDIFLYRALAGQQKYGVVINEIKSSSAVPLQALKLLSQYFQNPAKSDIVKSIEELMNQSTDIHPIILIALATIFCHEQDFEAALRTLNQSDALECRAMMVDLYLKMERLDCANKALKTLQELDDDATLTQLAQAWVHLKTGGEKVVSAYYIYQDLMDKNTMTPLLLNGSASCLLAQGKYEEAESILQDALYKDSNNPDTLINLLVLAHLSNKSKEVTNRYLSQLKNDHKSIPYVQNLLAKEADFDRVVKMYAC